MSQDDENALQARVDDLEVRISYQDKFIAELDDVVRSFSARVTGLERRLSELQDSVGSLEVGPADDKPPHY